MLESHHSLVVKALQKLYKHCVDKEGFPGEPLVETADGHPLTHAILDRLGLIKQAEENPDEPDLDTDDLQHLRILSTSTDCSAASEPSPEPATPPEPTLNNCNQLSRPLDTGGPWKWEYQPGQSYNYTYNGYQGIFPPPSLGPARLTHNAAATSAAPPQVPDHDASYPYYLDQGSTETTMKHRLPPDIMPGPSPYQPAPPTPGLPVDMLSDFNLPLDGQPLYSGLTPGWHFPSRQ